MRHLLRNRGIRLIWPSFRPGMRNSTRNVNRGQKLLKCRFARLARPLKTESAHWSLEVLRRGRQHLLLSSVMERQRQRSDDVIFDLGQQEVK